MALSLEKRIIYEDNHLLVVNKLAGELVQPDNVGTISLEQTIKEYIKLKYNKPGEAFLGVVHRIDRPVSGLVIFAKSGKALTRLNLLIQEKKIKKYYWAIVNNEPSIGRIKLSHYLVRNTKNNTSKVYSSEVPGSKLADLFYTKIDSSDHYYLLEVELITGRHHQIRAQLSAANMPIKGDLKYGARRSNHDASISLHARKVVFNHPVKNKELTLIAPVPDDNLWKFFEERSLMHDRSKI